MGAGAIRLPIFCNRRQQETTGGDSMTEIKIGGRTIPLLYTTYELVEIQKELGCTGFQLKDQVFGIRQTDEDNPESIVFDCVNDPERAEKMCRLIRILGNAGLEEAGENPDLTEKKILRALKPSEMMSAINACMDAMAEGMASEIPEEKPEGPVDVTLEEMNKKKEKEG
jgi:hypothetical protein